MLPFFLDFSLGSGGGAKANTDFCLSFSLSLRCIAISLGIARFSKQRIPS